MGSGQDVDQSTTSYRLVEAAARIEPVAWERLAYIYAPLIGNWARRFGLDRAEIEDVIQEVFAALIQGLPRYSPETAKFRSFLWGIARHKIADHLRTKSSDPISLESIPEPSMLDAEGDGEANPPSEEPADSLEYIFARMLPIVQTDFEQRTWKMFWRTAIEGQATRDVAEDFGVAAATVRKARSRVLRRLRAELRSEI